MREVTMPPLAVLISLLAACVAMLVFAAVRGAMFWRQRTKSNQRWFFTALMGLALLFPTLWLTEKLQRLGLPIPKPGMPDPASGEAVMFTVYGVIGAYLMAIVLVQLAFYVMSERTS
jgi:hypothetical protein